MKGWLQCMKRTACSSAVAKGLVASDKQCGPKSLKDFLVIRWSNCPIIRQCQDREYDCQAGQCGNCVGRKGVMRNRIT